jgi:hypothetical protein
MHHICTCEHIRAHTSTDASLRVRLRRVTLLFTHTHAHTNVLYDCHSRAKANTKIFNGFIFRSPSFMYVHVSGVHLYVFVAGTFCMYVCTRARAYVCNEHFGSYTPWQFLFGVIASTTRWRTSMRCFIITRIMFRAWLKFNTYIYIYMCVCVCVNMYKKQWPCVINNYSTTIILRT